MPQLPCVGRWGLFARLPTVLGLHLPALLILKHMPKNYINHVDTYNDHSKSLTINASAVNVPELLRAFMEDEQPKQESPVDDILPIPPKGKYTKVREYITERCRFDKDFKNYVDTHTRVDLCKRLTDEFGWDVDEHHLGVNMNRNRKT